MAMPSTIKFSGQIHIKNWSVTMSSSYYSTFFFFGSFVLLSFPARTFIHAHTRTHSLLFLLIGWILSVCLCLVRACAYVFLFGFCFSSYFILFFLFVFFFFKYEYVCVRVLYACIAFDAHSLTYSHISFRQMLWMMIVIMLQCDHCWVEWKCLIHTRVFKVRYRQYFKDILTQKQRISL